METEVEVVLKETSPAPRFPFPRALEKMRRKEEEKRKKEASVELRLVNVRRAIFTSNGEPRD